MPRATGPKPGKRVSTACSSGVAGRWACSRAWSVRMAARIARALALSPLTVWERWGSCGMTPSREGAWWRSTLLLYDVSGSVEKVIVRLRIRCTLIKSQWVLRTPTGSLYVLWPCDMPKGWPSRAQRVQHLARDMELQARRCARGALARLMRGGRGAGAC